MSEENTKSLEHIKASINNIIKRVSEDENFGKFKYRVNSHWEGGVLCKAQIRKEGHKLLVDEPPAFGGADLGASPVELVLVALGACQQIMFSALASIRDIPLEECDVKLTANLDVRGLLGTESNGKTCPGFSEIEYETSIKSSAPKEKLEALVYAVENQCPVMDMLTRNVKVEGFTSVNGHRLDVKSKSSSVA